VGVALVDGRTGAPPPAPTPMDATPTPGSGAPAAAAAAAAAAADAAGAGGGKKAGGAVTESVRPLAFKTLVGRGHPEFSSARQQVGGAGLEGLGRRERGGE
jgi:ubiquitin carboxyl-terminal hydrolase 5/13